MCFVKSRQFSVSLVCWMNAGYWQFHFGGITILLRSVDHKRQNPELFYGGMMQRNGSGPFIVLPEWNFLVFMVLVHRQLVIKIRHPKLCTLRGVLYARHTLPHHHCGTALQCFSWLPSRTTLLAQALQVSNFKVNREHWYWVPGANQKHCLCHFRFWIPGIVSCGDGGNRALLRTSSQHLQPSREAFHSPEAATLITNCNWLSQRPSDAWEQGETKVLRDCRPTAAYLGDDFPGGSHALWNTVGGLELLNT